MENISSLNSPHIERVKALIGPRGKKNRELENTFVVEGLQAVREALTPKIKEGLAVKKVYVTSTGLSKLQSEIEADLLNGHEIIEVSDQVMNAMADSQSQLKLHSFGRFKIQEMLAQLSEVQMLQVLTLWFSQLKVWMYSIRRL
jgi:tRNA G18 (ribose-2'-O)-methylase SpoU